MKLPSSNKNQVKQIIKLIAKNILFHLNQLQRQKRAMHQIQHPFINNQSLSSSDLLFAKAFKSNIGSSNGAKGGSSSCASIASGLKSLQEE